MAGLAWVYLQFPRDVVCDSALFVFSLLAPALDSYFPVPECGAPGCEGNKMQIQTTF